MPYRVRLVSGPDPETRSYQLSRRLARTTCLRSKMETPINPSRIDASIEILYASISTDTWA
jgi:hypothetical protein